MFNEQIISHDEAEVWGINDPHLKDFPIEGIGRRAMMCNRYDKCLYKAAVKDWEAFNCEGCRYENKGMADFCPSEFVPLADEFEVILNMEDGVPFDISLGFENRISWLKEEVVSYVNLS